MTSLLPIRPESSARRCVVLFAREAREEARRKRIPRAAPLFDRSERALRAAVRSLPGVDLLVFRPAGHRAWPAESRVFPQRGRTFAERIECASEDARALGYRQIVAVGCDSPGMSAAHLAGAFAELDGKPVVLGPAADGGVYLIGAANGFRIRFGEIPWQTRRTCRRLIEAHPEAALLPGMLSDLDGERDLRALRDRIQARPEARAEFDACTLELLFELFSGSAPRVILELTPPPQTADLRMIPPRGPPQPLRPFAGQRTGDAAPPA